MKYIFLYYVNVNRFLLRENYIPLDLFEEVKPHINLIGGTLSCDDPVIEKPYSRNVESRNKTLHLSVYYSFAT